ncbi:restriction endonuclease subunit S [Ruthenibacterium lactatiformans]|uniref:restriction endonuclease subunit S n=1 Tax=Ruthenibacterium lactatiformans TaxID=1550024 RepID=UPI003AB8B62E
MENNKVYPLENLLKYEQPTAYIVSSTDYSDAYRTPVLTAGKSFILGYTNESEGVFDKLPVIIFDDFTTATQYVNFKFKVKSSAMKILHINSELVTPKYIFYRMQTIQFDHSTHKRYWIQQYSKIKISVPPMHEQERIVARIEKLFSELDKAVETLKTTKQQLAVYRQAVLKEAFEGSFTVHRSCDLELEWSSAEETKNLPTIPKEWRYIELSKLGDLGRGKSKHRPRNDPKLFEDGKYPFLQTSEVKAAKQYITEFSKLYGEFGLQQSKLWPKGTLCITIAANIAETAFLGIDACFPDSVVGFTPYENISPEYIKHFIESQKLRLWAFAPATAQKNINLDTLENLIVPYCSAEEQKDVITEIETRMSICDSIEKTVDTALQQAEAMRHSILKQTFEERL